MTMTKRAEIIIPTQNEHNLEILSVLYHTEFPQELLILHTF